MYLSVIKVTSENLTFHFIWTPSWKWNGMLTFIIIFCCFVRSRGANSSVWQCVSSECFFARSLRWSGDGIPMMWRSMWVKLKILWVCWNKAAVSYSPVTVTLHQWARPGLKCSINIFDQLWYMWIGNWPPVQWRFPRGFSHHCHSNG